MSFSWTTEDKKNNNIFTFTGMNNVFVCFPEDSENCAKVTEIKIAENNTFDCQDEVFFNSN